MLATEDLYLVYAAFRDRRERPPLETLLTLNLAHRRGKVTVEEELAAQLASYDAAGDEAIRAALDLPAPNDEAALRRDFPDANPQVIARYLRLLGPVLHAARENRVVGVGEQDRVLVKLLNKLKHGFVAAGDPSGWPGAPRETVGPHEVPPPAPLLATVLLTGTTPATVDRWDVQVDEAAVDAYVAAIDTYAAAAEVIAVLCREVRAP
jgi:hypothetical protein